MIRERMARVLSISFFISILLFGICLHSTALIGHKIVSMQFFRNINASHAVGYLYNQHEPINLIFKNGGVYTYSQAVYIYETGNSSIHAAKRSFTKLWEQKKTKLKTKQNSPQMTGTRLHTENHKHEMQRLTHVTSSWLKITKARQQRR